VPDSTLRALGERPEAEVRLAAAMKLYELGRLSAGAAAELAGLHKMEFLSRLADYGIAAFDESPEELTRSLESVRSLRG
jgi:predicted HTH domain antitoxin